MVIIGNFFYDLEEDKEEEFVDIINLENGSLYIEKVLRDINSGGGELFFVLWIWVFGMLED